MATAASLDFATGTGASVNVVHWPSNLESTTLVALSSEFHIYHSTPVCKAISSFNEPLSKLLGELWRRGGKRKESLHLRLWNLNICVENVEAKCWLAEMTLVMTSLFLARVFQMFVTLALVSASRWLAEIRQLGRRGAATGELEVEFKFQRRSCKLSFLFPPRRQSTPESLLAGYP